MPFWLRGLMAGSPYFSTVSNLEYDIVFLLLMSCHICFWKVYLERKQYTEDDDLRLIRILKVSVLRPYAI